MNATAVLRAEKLTLGYGSVAAVHDLTLEVNEGEMVALMGANGAGKSTTLLGLAGELAPLGGSVWLDGAPTTAPLYRRARAGLAFIPEERSVIRGLTVIDNLRLGRGSLDLAFDLCPELRPLKARKAGDLSGGEQQMLTLARALSREPKVLLADELSLGLAPKVVERIMAALRVAADELGLAVLIVEQHAEVALELVDSAYVLRRGQMVMEGPAEDLRSRRVELEEHYLSTGTIEA